MSLVFESHLLVEAALMRHMSMDGMAERGRGGGVARCETLGQIVRQWMFE